MNIPKIIQQAIQYHEAGNLQQAEALYRKILEKNPDHPNALHLLGVLAIQVGNDDAAIQLINHAIKIDPNNHQYYFNLGLAFRNIGNPESAIQSWRRALKLNPGYAEAWNNIGLTFNDQQQHEAALDAFKMALKIKPEYLHSNYNLGNTYRLIGQYNDAIAAYQYTLQLKPDFANAWNNLGLAQRSLVMVNAAEESFRRAIKHNPGFAEAHGSLLFLLSYHVLRSPQEMLEESQHWDQAHGRDGKAQRFTHPTSGDTNKYPLGSMPGGVHKCLRIGYVSPDFWHHPVSYFLEPVLAAHDRTQVEVFCYAEVKQPDAVTQRLQALADHWRPTVGLSDQALAQLIFDDHIDILIDLAGHTANNRLKAFTYKPAPVQATYLGYFATTGLTTMDYWITDETLHPQDTVELATESLFRLPRCCLVYQAAPEAPEVIERSGKDIVFGSFNELSKTSPATITLWAKVLQAVPQARLLIKTKQLADAAIRGHLLQQFAAQNIATERLTLLPRAPSYREHLKTYGQVDIALDTIPRTGGSTTAEALWMGVPVISLAGERFIERLSASMLNAVGLDELIAESQDDYVTKAVALANDRQQLSLMRASLRERMAASPLCDAKGLAQSLESAYRDMWLKYLTPIKPRLADER